MASKTWNPFGVSMNITATVASVTRTSATKYSVKFNVSWNVTYSGNKTNYGMKATSGGGSKILNADGTKASSGSGSFTGTYSISGNRSASKTATVTFTNYSDYHNDSASKTIDLAVSVPAWTSYKVTYNANGGSGAPSADTKWKDQTLVLSSTKPTRTGYTFQGWAKTASGAVAYKSGASYTANAPVTLYAVWKIKTYKVTFNANEGTGGPTYQTKTYNQDLTLTTSTPTRTNYNFLGWSTSSTATTATYKVGETNVYKSNAPVTLYAVWALKTYKVTFDANGGAGGPTSQTKTHDTTLKISESIPTKTDFVFTGWAISATSTEIKYSPGSDYTSNEPITLYAVWVPAYNPPRITNVDIQRCFVNADTNTVTMAEEGTYAYVKFHYESDEEVKQISFSWKLTTDKDYLNNLVYEDPTGVISSFGTTGDIDATAGRGLIDPYSSYDFKIEVYDGIDTTSEVVSLDAITYTIDMLGGGNGVAFGKIAEEEDLADFEFQVYFRNGIRAYILSDNTDLNEVKIVNIYAGNAATTAGYLNCPITTGTSFTLEVLPAGGDGQIMQRITSCSKTGIAVYARHYYADAWGDWITI